MAGFYQKLAALVFNLVIFGKSRKSYNDFLAEDLAMWEKLQEVSSWEFEISDFLNSGLTWKSFYDDLVKCVERGSSQNFHVSRGIFNGYRAILVHFSAKSSKTAVGSLQLLTLFLLGKLEEVENLGEGLPGDTVAATSGVLTISGCAVGCLVGGI